MTGTNKAWLGGFGELCPFTLVSNGKAKVASAITDKGISTASDATFDTMASNIDSLNIKRLGTGFDESNFTAISLALRQTTIVDVSQYDALLYQHNKDDDSYAGILIRRTDCFAGIVMPTKYYGYSLTNMIKTYKISYPIQSDGTISVYYGGTFNLWGIK